MFAGIPGTEVGAAGHSGFFGKFRESSAWEPKHTVFAFGKTVISERAN
jgi:hypothetical protein